MELTKSVSLKINLGNYQTVDLFSSAKAECEPEDAEKKAEELHQFCVKQITKDRNTSLKYLANLVTEQEKKKLIDEINSL